jgi:hypothetical protein
MEVQPYSIGPKTLGVKIQNQLDLVEIVGGETQPFKNQNQDKINWTLVKIVEPKPKSFKTNIKFKKH